MAEARQVKYEVYLLQAQDDEPWVEKELTIRLKDQERMNPFFFRWESIAGDSKLQTMQKGFDESECCAVCLGEKGLGGLEQALQDAALNRMALSAKANPKYRVIPIILPTGDDTSIPKLLAGPDIIDFRAGKNLDEQFYHLVCSIKGKKPGRWPLDTKQDDAGQDVEMKKLKERTLFMLEVIEAAKKKGFYSEEAAATEKSKVLDRLMSLVTQETSGDITVQRVS